MKIAVAIATEEALPSAFVVFRGLEQGLRKAADLGYDGVELALMHKEQVDKRLMKRLLSEYGMEIPAVSTGQVFAGLNLWFTHPDPEIRRKAVDVFRGLVDLASELGAMVNIGRLRGPIPEGEKREVAEDRFLEVVSGLAEYSEGRGVKLLLEPVNRYEINFINSVDEGAALLRRLGRKNVFLMPDVFHMNIEDDSIPASFARNIVDTGYVHFADSNRLAPGRGHLNFPEIVGTLKGLGYDGWISVEILPKPNPDSAAAQAIRYLRTLIPGGREKENAYIS
jgi:sugar phosphate isomerase/epimerase